MEVIEITLSTSRTLSAVNYRRMNGVGKPTCYINNSHIIQFLKEGKDVKVVRNKTLYDVTHYQLVCAAISQEKRRLRELTTEQLKEHIRNGA